jgi:hypothetical protein
MFIGVLLQEVVGSQVMVLLFFWKEGLGKIRVGCMDPWCQFPKTQRARLDGCPRLWTKIKESDLFSSPPCVTLTLTLILCYFLSVFLRALIVFVACYVMLCRTQSFSPL